MKPQNIIIASCLLLMCCIMSNLHASTFHPQNVRSNNDTIQAVRLKALSAQEKSLQKKIQEQDKKRNATYNDVSTETMERLNDRQDSICLDFTFPTRNDTIRNGRNKERELEKSTE